MTTSEPLFDRLGGQDAVLDEFYHRILSDDRGAHHFEDTDVTKLRAHQAQFIAAVTGGLVEYDVPTCERPMKEWEYEREQNECDHEKGTLLHNMEKVKDECEDSGENSCNGIPVDPFELLSHL